MRIQFHWRVPFVEAGSVRVGITVEWCVPILDAGQGTRVAYLKRTEKKVRDTGARH